MSHKPMVLGAAIGALLVGDMAAVGADYSAATVASTRILEGIVTEGTIGSILLSPGGTRLIRTESSKLCLYDLVADPAALVSCGDLDRLGGIEDLFWSPDETKLAMPTFDDAILGRTDTDVVVLDLETWGTTNLTEDNFNDLLFGGPALMDVSVQWVDADTLMFVRYDIPAEGMGARGEPALAQVDIGGEVGEVFAPLATGRAMVYGLALSKDGQQVAYVYDDPDGNPKLYGIHGLEIGGKGPQRLVGTDAVGGIAPFGLSFSADGKYLLSLREHPEQNAGTIAMVLNLETKAVTYITAPDRTVFGVAWSPEGSALAYVAAEPTDGPDGPGGLFIAAPPDQPGRLVLAGPYEPAVCCGGGNQPFMWAANDTMVLGNMAEPDRPVLVQIGR